MDTSAGIVSLLLVLVHCITFRTIKTLIFDINTANKNIF